jgi:hypothetical protein
MRWIGLLVMSLIAGVASAQQLSGQSLYSWETPHAQVFPNGYLEWAPIDFQYVAGATVRYIDYENGDDSQDGTTPGTAWKHHPWDAQAIGNASAGSGNVTYVFKRGVVYRGTLNADESGAEGNPIRLTSDPSWGTGEAAIYGSLIATEGWTQADATVAPNIPNPTMVWYKNIGILENKTKVVCEITSEGIKRVRLARSPNFVDTPNEPMKMWWSFTNKANSGGYLNLTDANNLTQSPAAYYQGGDVWAIEDAVTMATLWKKNILNYNPTTKTIQVALDGGYATFGGKDCKYYVENTPYLLDSPGEYYYDHSTGRIFIRLEGDKDPNTTTVEIASKSKLMNFSSKHDIEISGLTIGFTTYDDVRYGYNDGMPALMFQNSYNIAIKNCKFQYVNGGIMANGAGPNWQITDNEMYFMDDFAVMLNGPDVMSILRNKVVECGTRHLGRWYSCIPTIAADPLTDAEVAGNIIEHAWGSAINLRWGKTNPSGLNIPFIRGFVHHNRVTHSLQGVNDYGGIENWQGGPVFTYNNISEDAQGWHYNWWIGNVISLGYPYYNDGVFKHYVFNNISRGTGWNRTSGAYMMVMGYYNMYVHNDAYNALAFSNSGDFDFAIDGQNYYLANVSDSTERQFDHTTIPEGVPFDSYGQNFFSGRPFQGCFVTNGTEARYKLNFKDFYGFLNSFEPDLGTVGYVTSKRVFENPSAGDFRPTVSSEVIDQGVKFFIPFPLSHVVGEWNFCKHRSDSSLVKGENFYYTSEFVYREMYKTIPKNHLKAYGLAADSYVKGELEDFTEGALEFDGTSTYCTALNSATSRNASNNLNMTTNDFIIETYFKTEVDHTLGALAAKYLASGYGYQLDIDGSGFPRLSIMNNGSSVFSQSGATAVNDGNWHHVLVEVLRESSQVIVYVDGVASIGSSTGSMPASGVSLTNTADFFAGKNLSGHYLAGTMDLLRISKGSLEDAKTTIEELYKWQFNGPFLYDFAGNAPVGRRDAGAIERGAKLCDMVLSSRELRFDGSGGTQSVTIEADAGFEIIKKVGSFFTHSLENNTLSVTIPASANSYYGEVHVLGCNETVIIKVIQGNPTAVEDIRGNEIMVSPNPVTSGQINIMVPEGAVVQNATFTTLSGEVISQHDLVKGNNLIPIDIPNGMYLLKIFGSSESYTTKIMVNQ